METRAYIALYLDLSGTPRKETGTSPPSSQLLDNRLYILLFCDFVNRKIAKWLNLVSQFFVLLAKEI